MKSRNFVQALGWATVVVLLLSVGIFLYSQWDLKRFNASLPEVPTMDTAAQDTPNAKGVTEELADSEPIPVVTHPSDATSESIAETKGASVEDFPESPASVAWRGTGPRPTGPLALVEEGDGDTLPEEGDVAAASDGLSYDVEIVKAGFDDYNAYLDTHPAYAYQRLDDAFREQYGDSADVDVLVETVQRSNEGTGTIDDAIANAEAFLRLLPPSVPPENVQEVVEQVAYLKELRQLAADEGIEMPFKQTYRFGGM